MFSRLPAYSRCAGPTLVMTATSGAAIRQSSLMSPADCMPISTTMTSVPSAADSSVSGTPTSLLKLARLATKSSFGESRPESMSLVEVLPVLPVMATTVAPLRLATSEATPFRASPESSTAMTTGESPAPLPFAALPLPLPFAASIAAALAAASRAASTPLAPPASASATNSPPSKFSPRRATNSLPARSARVSVEISTTAESASPARSSPAQASQISCAVSVINSSTCTGMEPDILSVISVWSLAAPAFFPPDRRSS